MTATANWVAQILVGEPRPATGSSPLAVPQIVVKCILGAFYGDNPVNSNVKVTEKTTIDGHDAWLVESQLTFDIAGLRAKGELLIVAIVSAGNRSGLYYAIIPHTKPELVQPARDALQQLQVDARKPEVLGQHLNDDHGQEASWTAGRVSTSKSAG